MKKLIFTLFSLLFCFNSFAQDEWQCVYSNKKVYFENTNNVVYCIRIDSTSNDNTVLYPFSDLHQIDWDCYSVTSGSWLSKYIILDEDENTIFVNGKNQQILIKNKAALNDNWILFENENIKIKGQIMSISLKSVLGVEDSVKTINFFVYNHSDEPINHALNQFSIEISKHFGLVKTINFYYLEHSADYFYHFDEFYIIGISEPQLGFQNVNLREQYFDFQVGDEFHIWQESTQTYSNVNKIINRYLSRTDYQDSIVYYYERKINKYIPYLNIDTVLIDTLKQNIIKGLLFDTESNEPYGDLNVSKVVIINHPVPKIYLWDTHLYWEPSTFCFTELIWDGCYTSGTYFLKLGGPYNECCEWGLGKYCYDLVYYKKGDTEWGVPFNLPVSEYKKEVKFSIYPNPANNNITIKSANNEKINNCILEIYDIYGRKYLSKKLDISECVDVSLFKSGYYIVKLNNDNNKIIYLKFIKQ